MGNCIRREKATKWGGEDWGSITSNRVSKNEDQHDLSSSSSSNIEIEKQSLLGLQRSFSSSTTTELKIKITKKQLEELVGGAHNQGLSIEQVLASLIKASDGYQLQHQRSWRPSLQSIPEIN